MHKYLLNVKNAVIVCLKMNENEELTMNIDRFRKNYNPCPKLKALADEIKDTGEILESVIGKTADSREKAIALTKLEESVMWAVKGVYR